MTTKTKIIIGVSTCLIVLSSAFGYGIYNNYQTNKKQDVTNIVFKNTDIKHDATQSNDTSQSLEQSEETDTSTNSFIVEDHGQVEIGNTWLEWDTPKLVVDDKPEIGLGEGKVAAIPVPSKDDVIYNVDANSQVKKYIKFNKASDESYINLRDKLVNSTDQIKQAYIEYDDPRAGSTGETPLKTAVNGVISDNFMSNDTYLANYLISLSRSKFLDININVESLKAVNTDTPNVLAFETYLVNQDGYKVSYVTGFYNENLQQFTISYSGLTHNGAVLLNNTY